MKASAEISEQRGKRRFIASLFLAALLGLGVRIVLSPAKVERKIRDELARSELSESLTFETARVSLANGWLPDFAIVLGRVEWREPRHCAEIAPLRATSVRVPIRMLSLLRGVPAGGRATIDDLVVDVDGLKEDCSRSADEKPPKPSDPPSETKRTTVIAVDPSKALERGEIWSVEVQERSSAMISGLVVSRAEIFFEKRMKSVVIENLRARWRGPNLELSTNLSFPPSAVFGESLPSFDVTGTIAREGISAKIQANLNEGLLEASAELKPVVVSGRQELESDVKLSVSNLPLSVVTPLFVKSQAVSERFRPKFLWLDCRAEVQGIFSRLLVDHPVTFSGCSISGRMGRITIDDEAVREPSGEWRPLSLGFEKLDLAHAFETFHLEGPSGVLSSFGQMTGTIRVQSRDSMVANARWEQAAIRFAGTEGIALQPLAVDSLSAKLQNRRWMIELSNFKLEEGRAEILLKADLDARSFHGDFDLNLSSLKLASRVEKVLFNGTVAEISGSAKASTDLAGKLSKLRANVVLKGLQGSEVDSSEARLEARLEERPKERTNAQSASHIELSARTVGLEVAKSGRLYRLLEPTLLGWPGELARQGQRLVLRNAAIRGHFTDAGFEWSEAKASVGPRVGLTSRGRIARDHKLEAEIVAQYPLVSRLKWSISGSWLQPTATVASPELGSLLSKAGVEAGASTGTVPRRWLGVGEEDLKDTQEVRSGVAPKGAL